MKRLDLLRLLALSFSCLFLTACSDSDSDTDDSDIVGLEINPSSLSINVDSPQTVVLSVAGGSAPYRWSVSDPQLGTVDATGNSVVYQSTTATGPNVIMASDSLNNVGTVVVSQTR